jgi:hypothetical protein
MTPTERTFMGSGPQETFSLHFGKALAAELRRRHHFHAAKRLSQDLDVGVRTAENILEGHLSSRTLTLIVSAYGPGPIIDAAASVAGHTLETFITEQAAAAEQAEARAKERAYELNRLRSRLHTVPRGASGDDRPSA